MTDKYDRAIEYLTEHPDQIVKAWAHDCAAGDEPELLDGELYPPNWTGRLFDVASDHKMYSEPQPEIALSNEDHRPYSGCLTQVAAGTHLAKTAALTLEIRADKRIPTDEYKITVQDLPVFAEWQRKIDRELGREVDDQ